MKQWCHIGSRFYLTDHPTTASIVVLPLCLSTHDHKVASHPCPKEPKGVPKLSKTSTGRKKEKDSSYQMSFALSFLNHRLKYFLEAPDLPSDVTGQKRILYIHLSPHWYGSLKLIRFQSLGRGRGTTFLSTWLPTIWTKAGKEESKERGWIC